jgi:hypothetical protein
MKHAKLFAFPNVLVVVVAVFLFRTGFASAASASSCGKWNIIKSPNVGSISILNAVAAVSANDVWAVGTSTGNQSLIEHWDGTSWSVVSSPSLPGDGSLSGLAVVSADDIWAVGNDYGGTSQNSIAVTEHWNGTQWSIVLSPNFHWGNALVGATVISTDNVWAVGYYYTDDTGSLTSTLVEHWNGKQWSVVSSPTPTNDEQYPLVSASAISANDIWAVGYGGNSGPPEDTLTEHWNGKKWSIANSPNIGTVSILNGVAAVSTSNVWAVGASGTTNALIEHWNGKSWSTFKNPGSSINGTLLTGVAELSSGNIWAVGYTTNNSNVEQTFIEHWNGKKWSVMHSPNAGKANNELSAVAGIAGTSQVWAVGSKAAGYYTGKSLVEAYC